MVRRISLACVVALGITLLLVPIASAGQQHRVLDVSQAPVERVVPLMPDTALSQPPNQSNGLFADIGCDICGSGVQVVAENFLVATGGLGFDLEQIVIWGGFYPGNTFIAAPFEVLVHSDLGGLPDVVICLATGVNATSATTTGLQLFGVDEYMITLDLPTACSLSDGTYWVELYTNTGLGTDDFFWETGNVDPVAGIPGSVWVDVAPGSGWNIDSAQDLSLQLNGTTVPVELQSFLAE